MKFNLIALALAASTATAATINGLQTRDSVDNTCGNTAGGANKGQSCATTAGQFSCCSSAGYCGDSDAHCGTGCQPQFGQCGTSTGVITPSSSSLPASTSGSTDSISRTKVGSIQYGADIYTCNTPGTVALTYDDGPFIYTNDLLDLLSQSNAKATFFITGANIADKGKQPIDTPGSPLATVLQRMDSDGHQLASHTWTHADLSTASEADRITEMTRLETALMGIVGKAPTYMRPPYSSCTAASGCTDTMDALGYHMVSFNVDTDDYNNVTPDLVQNAKDKFAAKVAGTDAATQQWLAIAHDIHEQTVYNLTAFMLTTLETAGYRAVTVGECLGDPVANWYRS
ncbi:hypothetical protein EDC01DRAFT_661196 [Geopyxis carbonaria]|nr:hypothetical protein EDC01DRAFT_661196 [Geopyxis carbonaria]